MNDNAPTTNPPTLTGRLVELQPLQPGDSPRLLEAAADGELWNSKVTTIPGPDTVDGYLALAMEQRRTGAGLPFIVIERATGRVLGTTRFFKIDPANRTMEIGYTWLRASVQRSGVNTEAKFLLLRHAFEAMQATRVQFITDQLNQVSRNAILRLGAKEEGCMRNERIMPDGRKRNSMLFSIVDVEWPAVKAGLQAKMAR